VQINGKTKIYGLFGEPVEHTGSPAMHNAAFKKLSINAVYLAFRVKPSEIKQALKGIVSLGFSGINLTIPHKQICLPYLDKVDREAKLIGAANTLVLKGGRLLGYNTDAPGFLKSLKQDLGQTPRGSSVFLLGAGGAGRAVAMAAAKNKAKEIILADLVPGRSRQLAGNLKTHFPHLPVKTINLKKIGESDLAGIDLLINATPVGMRSTDPFPVNPGFLRPGVSIYDLVYNISPTRLVRMARRRGLKAVNGLGMLVWQAALAFELWTGRKPPVDLMRRELEKQVLG